MNSSLAATTDAKRMGHMISDFSAGDVVACDGVSKRTGEAGPEWRRMNKEKTKMRDLQEAKAALVSVIKRCRGKYRKSQVHPHVCIDRDLDIRTKECVGNSWVEFERPDDGFVIGGSAVWDDSSLADAIAWMESVAR